MYCMKQSTFKTLLAQNNDNLANKQSSSANLHMQNEQRCCVYLKYCGFVEINLNIFVFYLLKIKAAHFFIAYLVPIYYC